MLLVGFYGLFFGKEYGVIVLVMDELGDLYKSSEILIIIEEDGQYIFRYMLNKMRFENKLNDV